MKKLSKKWIILALSIILIFRFCLSLTTYYQHDLNTYMSWMDSVQINGWEGIYDRKIPAFARVDYPPIALYAFWLSERTFKHLPEIFQTIPVRVSLYKLPSIIADCLIAYLIWRFAPFSKKWKAIMSFAFLFNPALLTNSVIWGQVESLSALTAIATILAIVHKRGDIALFTFTIALLTKQNILPLTPLILYGIWSASHSFKKIIIAAMASLNLVILAYLPLVPHNISYFTYIFQTYLRTIAGQANSQFASYNALNYWYFLGLNKVGDLGLSGWGMML